MYNYPRCTTTQTWLYSSFVINECTSNVQLFREIYEIFYSLFRISPDPMRYAKKSDVPSGIIKRSVLFALLSTNMNLVTGDTNHSHGTGHVPATHEDLKELPLDGIVYSVVKGGRIELDLHAVCLEKNGSCHGTELSITSEPTEGVLFEQRTAGNWAYQHGGTSEIVDLFEVSRVVDGELLLVIPVEIAIGKFSGNVDILSPESGSRVMGSEIVVTYQVSGEGFDHLHLQIGDEEHVSLKERKGTHKFKDVSNGPYIVSATLARRDHRTISSTRKQVEIEVVNR